MEQGPKPSSHPENPPPCQPAHGPSQPSGPPPLAQFASPQDLVLRRPPSRTGLRVLVVLLLLGLAGSVLLNLVLGLGSLAGLGSSSGSRTVRERFYSHEPSAADKVAIISLEGTILSSEGFIKDQIDQATDDEDVKAVVVRIDSPGGTITGSDQIYHQLCEMAEKKEIPIVISMGGLAASGGYYVAMACGDTPDTIFAEPTTWTGSIGVIIPHYDLSKLLDDWGVKQDSITSHPLKGMGSIAKPLTAQEREIFQVLVDEGFTLFKDVIYEGRPRFDQDPAALDKLATGQVYTAQQAVANGLVDKIGFLPAAVDRAIELAKLNPNSVRVVQYHREPTLADLFMTSQANQGRIDLAMLLDMTAPRAYYLCTWLPSLAGTAKP